MLTRYWFKTDCGLGYGVTASSLAQARELLRSHGYPLARERIIDFVEDVEIASLDNEHVRPYVGPVRVPGIWFPKLNV